MTSDRVRLQNSEHLSTANFGVYTLRDVGSPGTLSIIDGLATHLDLLEANVKECKAEQDSRMAALRSTVDG